MRLNSRTGTEGLPMPSINCDRPLQGHLSVMSVGHQIIDGYRLHTKYRSLLCRPHCDQAAMAERNLAGTVCLSDVVHRKPINQ